jgi:hypothetical protein
VGAVPDDVVSARAEVDGFVADLGWHVSLGAPSRRMLADALVALRRLGWETGVQAFAPYAAAADSLARGEVDAIPSGTSRAETVEFVVVGTVVFEAVLAALRRMAQEHYSAQRLGTRRGKAVKPRRRARSQ